LNSSPVLKRLEVFLRLRINKGIKEKEQRKQIGKKEREKLWKSNTKKKNERCQAVGEDSLCLTLYLKVKGMEEKIQM
jgi:hypothetical protein